jgi:hypothetical protein
MQAELCDAVLAQRGERDPAEVSHHDVLEHHRGQMVGGVARNTIEADAVTHTGAGDVREMMGCHRVLAAGIDTKANTRAAVHPRLVIFVSLRMAASAVTPSVPIVLCPRLRARGGAGMVGEQACQRALTRK